MTGAVSTGETNPNSRISELKNMVSIAGRRLLNTYKDMRENVVSQGGASREGAPLEAALLDFLWPQCARQHIST